jgi:hypothetical protein
MAESRPKGGTMQRRVQIGGSYRLTDHDGRVVTDETFHACSRCTSRLIPTETMTKTMTMTTTCRTRR